MLRVLATGPRPVVTPAESERKAIASMGSQFRNTESNVERIIREAQQNAPTSKVAAVEREVLDERGIHECLREAQETLERFKASSGDGSL